MMRDCRRDLVKLSEHRRLICRLNHCLIAGYDKCENRSEGCGEAHLEARPARDQPLLLQLQEYGVRCPGHICVAEPLKDDLTGRKRRTQPETRPRNVATGIGRGFLKLGIALNEAGLPSDPVGPLTRLTVGHTPQTPTQNRTGCA